jgi:hypothetical protein
LREIVLCEISSWPAAAFCQNIVLVDFQGVSDLRSAAVRPNKYVLPGRSQSCLPIEIVSLRHEYNQNCHGQTSECIFIVQQPHFHKALYGRPAIVHPKTDGRTSLT